MAVLTRQQVTLAGKAITYQPAAVGGDTFAPADRIELRVKNGHSAAQSVTVVVPGNTRWGQSEPDVTVSIPAGAEYAFGPFPGELANPATGYVGVTYIGTTALTVALVGV